MIKKILITVLVLILMTAAVLMYVWDNAQASRWEAGFTDQSCFVHVESLSSQVEDRYFFSAYLHMGRSRNIKEAVADKVGYKLGDYVMHAFISVGDLEKGSDKSMELDKVSILLENKVFDMVEDSRSDDDFSKKYFLVNESVEEVWATIRAGGKVEIEITVSDGLREMLTLPKKGVKTVSVMYDACEAEVTNINKQN